MSQQPFKKLPECSICTFFAESHFLHCTIHPSGVKEESCQDFRSDPQAEQRQAQFLKLDWVTGEECQPEGASYYAGELIIDAVQRFNREQRLEMLDWHPVFTGRCPDCEQTIAVENPAQTHWDCACGWKDDSF
jgi:hypothetical protein